jgi:hypothetical protein
MKSLRKMENITRTFIFEKTSFDYPNDYKRIVTKWLKAQRDLREAEGDI